MKNDHIFHLFLCGLTALCLLASTGCASKRYGNLPPEISGASASRMGVNIVRTATTQLANRTAWAEPLPAADLIVPALSTGRLDRTGLLCPRVTSSQAKVGTKVAINRLQPGDIVVFRTKNAPNGLHTGIYVGSGRFIHSPNSRSRVRVDDLSPSSYWRKRLVMGRRLR